MANLAAAALVLGQFLGPQALSWWSIGVGSAFWIVLVSAAVVLVREEDR